MININNAWKCTEDELLDSIHETRLLKTSDELPNDFMSLETYHAAMTVLYDEFKNIYRQRFAIVAGGAEIDDLKLAASLVSRYISDLEQYEQNRLAKTNLNEYRKNISRLSNILTDLVIMITVAHDKKKHYKWSIKNLFDYTQKMLQNNQKAVSELQKEKENANQSTNE